MERDPSLAAGLPGAIAATYTPPSRVIPASAEQNQRSWIRKQGESVTETVKWVLENTWDVAEVSDTFVSDEINVDRSNQSSS